MSLSVDVRRELAKGPATAAHVAVRLGTDVGLVEMVIDRLRASGDIAAAVTMGACGTTCSAPVLRTSCAGCPFAPDATAGQPGTRG